MTAPPDISPDILDETRDGILRITFNRPQARNAFTFAMYERLAELCRMAEERSDIRAVLLTGAGEKAFAAGTDISQFRAFSTPEDAIGYEERIGRVVGVVEACGKPTIAAIAGACTGGGAAIAAACDLRIAAPNIRFGFPIARTLGNCLSMSNYARLAALIGPARVTEIIFTARLVEAEEAKTIGLVHEVVADIATLMPRAEAVAQTVAENAPLTLRATKEALRRLRPAFGSEDGRDLILMCYMSADFREGMDAFLNKRKPAWTGH
ncbi:MAG TPA: enoyl-CoA hydratase/isomerase family protein [Acetobacteraceae bacterium]|nr:enoyl-CoA hydratase/isomerase family protein [Acetobacteraceae bacterium]